MTIDEAIQELRYPLKRRDNPEERNSFLDAIELAISALRAQQETEKNEPLTLEDLKQMDGQAVWLNNSRHSSRCFIVNNKYVFRGRIVPCGIEMWGQPTSLSLLAEIGLYRRPPEWRE